MPLQDRNAYILFRLLIIGLVSSFHDSEMVLQSLACIDKRANSISSATIDSEAATECRNLVVSGVSIDDGGMAECSGGDLDNSIANDSSLKRRRTSARIQKLKNEKALRVCNLEQSAVNHEVEERVVPKRTKVYNRRKARLSVVVGGSDVGTEVPVSNQTNDCAVVENGSDGIDMGSAKVADIGMLNDKSAYTRVTETLRTFNKHYLHFVQEEESRCRRLETKPKRGKGLNSKNGEASEDKRGSKLPDIKATTKNGEASEDKRGAKRPDLKAITKMMETNAILNHKKRFGKIPGIDVGHQFFSRAEMVAVGFHSHWLNGIDFIGQSAHKEFGGYKLPLAVAIVLSGQYEDDLDNSEDIVYTGQGGNNLLGDKRQFRDQEMLRGNLGLKNCMEQGVSVRVVRGHQSRSSYVGKVYTYDGLYKVVNYWAEKGVSGFTVFKFRLKRLDGQPVLTTNQVQYSRGRAPNSISEIRGLVCEDITAGQEDIPIPATNLVDVPPVAPTGFTYCNYIKVAKGVKLPMSAPGCNCKGTCIDPRSCACARLNGSDFPYVHRDGGRLIEPKAVVFECGPNCGCGPGCVNRTSQRGLKYRLEVFRTPKKGWAVRSWDYIPSGAPVCEYTGILMKTDEIDTFPENNYIFDIDCLQTMKGLDGRESRLRDVSMPAYLEKDDDKKSDNGPEFCIDAGSTGNIARFINHSCQPNLFVQCVLSTHHDIKLARVVLFAADNIPPLKELAYDYGYALDSVIDPDGKTRQMACYCGAPDCRKRLL